MRLGALLLLLSACSAPVSRAAIEAQRPAPGELHPEVVEASAPERPEWVERSMERAGDAMAFVGRASAPSLEAAKERATRDLYAAIASFVAVEVRSEESDRSFARTAGGVATSGQALSTRVETRAGAKLRGVAPDAFYWQRVLATPYAAGGGEYEYAVHAVLPRAEIQRARQERQSGREVERARSVVALLPFRGPAPEAESFELGAALEEQLAAALAAEERVHLQRGPLVRGLVSAPGMGQSEAVERVQDGLLPDWILSGLAQRSGERVRLSLVLYEGQTGRPAHSEQLEERYAELPDLWQAAAGWTAARTRPKRAPPARPRPRRAAGAAALAAFEAYHRAEARAAVGDMSGAITAIERALELDPTDASKHLRHGRILERMGRYARIEQVGAARALTLGPLDACTQAARTAEGRARAALAERLSRLSGPAPAAQAPWWEPTTLGVDAALALLTYAPRRGWSCDRPPAGARSALEAYLRALHHARDFRQRGEAALAVADLAVRVDRQARAEALFTFVQADARALQDAHLESLASYGRGVLYRRMGRLDAASRDLLAARALRAELGEKPLLLEIDNELAQVALELGELELAEHRYRAAERLAEELGSEYLSAVLGNNLAVLEHTLGGSARAERRLHASFDVLSSLQEREGLGAVGINLGRLLALRGERLEADDRFRGVERALEASRQEGRLAELALHQGLAALGGRQVEDALFGLERAELLFAGLGRATDARRAAHARWAAEQVLLPVLLDSERDEAARCMAGRYVTERSPAFEPRQWREKRAHPARPDDFFALPPPGELALAANAALLVPQTDFVSPTDEVVAYQAPPPPAPPLRPEPPAGPRRPTKDEEEDEDRPELERPEREESVRPEPPRPAAAQESVVAGVPLIDALGGARAEPEQAPVQVQKAVSYERILGAFLLGPEAWVILEPGARRTLDRALVPSALRTLDPLLGELERRRLAGPAAVTRLNKAALAWADWRPEEAYAGAQQAARSFAELGDLRGLAQAHEWLGLFLGESGAAGAAAQHLALAAGLYAQLGDAAGEARALGPR